MGVLRVRLLYLKRNWIKINTSSFVHWNKMNKEISITTNNPVLYGSLNINLLDGIKIISEPPIEKRGIGFDISINFDINIIVDLGKISAYVFAGWLISRTKRLRGNHKININRQQIPVDHPKAIELVTKEIEHKE